MYQYTKTTLEDLVVAGGAKLERMPREDYPTFFDWDMQRDFSLEFYKVPISALHCWIVTIKPSELKAQCGCEGNWGTFQSKLCEHIAKVLYYFYLNHKWEVLPYSIRMENSPIERDVIEQANQVVRLKEFMENLKPFRSKERLRILKERYKNDNYKFTLNSVK